MPKADGSKLRKLRRKVLCFSGPPSPTHTGPVPNARMTQGSQSTGNLPSATPVVATPNAPGGFNPVGSSTLDPAQLSISSTPLVPQLLPSSSTPTAPATPLPATLPLPGFATITIPSTPTGQTGGVPTPTTTPDPTLTHWLLDPTNPSDDIFRTELQRHKDDLTPPQQTAFLNASAVDLLTIIQDLNHQHQQGSPLREPIVKAQRFLQAADGYLKVLAVPAQYNQIAVIAVGGLKLFVDIGMRYVGFFDKLAETMDLMSGHLDYLSRYGKLYSGYPEVKMALCDAYGDLILFFKTTCGIFMQEDGTLNSKISARVFFKQLSSPLESTFDDINVRFNAHVTKIEKTANIMEQGRKLLQETLEARKIAVSGRRNLLVWLSQLEPEREFERLFGQRHPGTGLWLVESPEFKEWLQAGKHCLLWCHGSAGVGKSVLASIVIEETKSLHLLDPRVGIAFFYFNFQTDSTITQILSILIKQLCRRMTLIPKHVLDLYTRCTYNDERPTLAQLEKLFEETIACFEQVFLVVDAMDECKKDHRKSLLPYIVSLLATPQGNVKLFVTSRPEGDITMAFGSGAFKTIRVEVTKVSADTASYVRHELDTRHHPCYPINTDSDLKRKVEDALVGQSNGMFLWVKCQLDYIFELPSKTDIEQSLKILPDNMTETYNRIITKISSQAPAMVSLARRALTWVVTAKRPLDSYELSIVIAIEPTTTSTRQLEDRYQKNVAIEACCGLFTDDGGFVRPIHFTVEEFLKANQSFVLNEGDANAELARCAITYLLCEEFIEIGFIDREENESSCNDGLTYIFSYWDDHLRKAPWPLPTDIRDSLQILLTSDNGISMYEARTYLLNNYMLKSSSVLALCAVFDILNVYKELYPADSSTLTSKKLKDALDNAARVGSITAVQEILRLMSDEDSRSYRSLQLAAASGNVEVVRFFIDRGAEIDSRSDSGNTALFEAAQRGRGEVVALLIQNGANVNAHGGQDGSPLEAAASQGYKDIVEILIANDADVNARSVKYEGALLASISERYSDIAEILVANGADVNAGSEEYGNALQTAAYEGENEIVKNLIANGADINAQGGKYGNALQAAAYKGENEIVKNLIANGADVNAQGGKYGNALQSAGIWGYKDIVEILIAHGADVNAGGGEYGNALQAAGIWGYKDIVEILIANGADVNAQDGSYNTALQAASHFGHKEVVEILLANFADVNLDGGIYGTALQAAVSPNYRYSDIPFDRPYECEIVNILIDNGANVNAKGGNLVTPSQLLVHGTIIPSPKFYLKMVQ